MSKRKLYFLGVLTGIILGVLLITPCHADDYSITLGWTSPYDDTTDAGEGIGTCTAYDGRWSYDLICLTDPVEFINCDSIPNMPLPLEFGTYQTHTFMLDLQSNDTLYFAIRSIDEVGNISPISNVTTRIFSDDINPSAVGDLNVNVVVRVIIE